jgi:hypothetical protein
MALAAATLANERRSLREIRFIQLKQFIDSDRRPGRIPHPFAGLLI